MSISNYTAAQSEWFPCFRCNQWLNVDDKVYDSRSISGCIAEKVLLISSLILAVYVGH